MLPPSTIGGFFTDRPGLVVSRFRQVPRRFLYAVVGVVLALGAPVGLACLRLASTREVSVLALSREIDQDLGAFLYVTLSTMLVFFAFGYVLGRQADALLDLSAHGRPHRPTESTRVRGAPRRRGGAVRTLWRPAVPARSPTSTPSKR